MADAPKEPTIEELKQENDRLKALIADLQPPGKVNRRAKDAVFIGLAEIPKYRRQIYQALHPEDIDTTEDDIALVSIENILTIKPYNDVGLMLGGKRKRKLLILAEAQAKWSVNVLIRLLQYIVDSIMNYFIANGEDLYSSVKLDMPDVEAYIIYTGKSIPRFFKGKDVVTDERGRIVLSLNKEFFNGEAGKPELQAKVIYAKNGSGILDEYIQFSQIFNEQRVLHKDNQEEMISEVFRICEERNVLQEYLKSHRAEVEKIMMTMVSPEYVREASAKTEQIRGAIDMARSFGISDDKIREQLMQNFHITVGYAQNFLDTDWEEDDAQSNQVLV